MVMWGRIGSRASGGSTTHFLDGKERGEEMKGKERGKNVTGDDPHASDALLAFDAILHYASRSRLDDAPVRVDAG